jgi:hypothetical protein
MTFTRRLGCIQSIRAGGRGSVLRQPPGDNTHSHSVCYAAVKLKNRRLYGMYFSYPLQSCPLPI